MLGMLIGVGVMNAMFGENMRCYRDVNSNDAPAPSPPGYVQCGTSRGNYILADSGARDCTGCGEAILSYDACLTAARSGTTAHYDSPEPSAALGKSENWDGPPGCQIRDEGSNFQFNANMDGASARVGYTPVCLISSSRREMFEEMHHIAAQHPSGDGVARVKLALSNIAQTFGLGATIKQLPAALALSPEGRKLEDTHIYLEVARPNDDSCHFYTSDGTCHDGEGGSLNAWCSCGTPQRLRLPLLLLRPQRRLLQLRFRRRLRRRRLWYLCVWHRLYRLRLPLQGLPCWWYQPRLA